MNSRVDVLIYQKVTVQRMDYAGSMSFVTLEKFRNKQTNGWLVR